MAVLVTGGHGFVGAWVVRRLAERGDEVVVYDAAGPPDRVLDEVADRVRHVRGDVLDFPRLARTIADDSVTGVIHAAALIGARVNENPHGAIRVNVMGTLNVLEAVRQSGDLPLVYVSSGAVYGEAEGPLRETDPMTPSDPYGATKAACEHLCDQYAATYGVRTASARIFFVYGPGRAPHPEGGFNTMLFAPLAGIEKVVFPSGADQKADWTYVDDAARGIIMMLDAAPLPNRAYNIATGTAHSVADVVEAVKRHAPVAPRIDIGPGVVLKRGAPLDIGRAGTDFGYRPEFDLEAGIRAYGQWFSGGSGNHATA